MSSELCGVEKSMDYRPLICITTLILLSRPINMKRVCFVYDPNHDLGPQAGQNRDIGSSCNNLVITGVMNDSTTDTTSLNDSGI